MEAVNCHTEHPRPWWQRSSCSTPATLYEVLHRKSTGKNLV